MADRSTSHALPSLLPCPFCGSRAQAYDDGEDCIATCTNEKCDAIPCVVGNSTVAQAIDRWNRRSALSESTPTDAERDLAMMVKRLIAKIGHLTDNKELVVTHALNLLAHYKLEGTMLRDERTRGD